MTIAMTMGTTIVMTTLMTINYDNLYDKFFCMSMPACNCDDSNSRCASECWIIIVTALAAVMSMRVSKSQESNIDPNSHAQPAPEF